MKNWGPHFYKMGQKKNGSTIVILLFVVSALTLVLTAALRNATFSFDIALQQARYEQQRWITEGILNYGIAYVKMNAVNIVKNNTEITIPTNYWTAESFKGYEGTLKIIPDNDRGTVIAQLKKDHELVMSMQCQCNLLFEDKEKETLKNISISDWHINEIV